LASLEQYLSCNLTLPNFTVQRTAQKTAPPLTLHVRWLKFA
jgi:hypothetical protein